MSKAFDASTFFLTYPQSNLTSEELLDFFKTKGNLLWARICQEQHGDGGHHQHVVCRYDRRIQTRDCRFFDLNGQHPNIQSVRSVAKSLAYVSKDGQFLDFGPVPAQRDTDTDWIALAATLPEGEYFLRAQRARIQFAYAEKFWKLGSPPLNTILETYEPNLTWESMDLNLTFAGPGSTVLVGPTGIGKTSWAKRVSNKPALWVRHLDVLLAFKPGYHKSIIFDECSFHHLPRETQIQITDYTDEAQIHCRYKYAVIPSGIQKIFTANFYPFAEDPAIDRRVTKINF